MDLLRDFQEMSSQFEAWTFVFMVLLCGAVFGALIIETVGLKRDYRRGQIDALNGKIKYEKRENEDGELVWEEKPKVKKGATIDLN